MSHSRSRALLVLAVVAAALLAAAAVPVAAQVPLPGSTTTTDGGDSSTSSSTSSSSSSSSTSSSTSSTSVPRSTTTLAIDDGDDGDDGGDDGDDGGGGDEGDDGDGSTTTTVGGGSGDPDGDGDDGDGTATTDTTAPMTPDEAAAAGAGDGAGAAARVMPEWFVTQMNAIERSDPRNTRRLLELLQPLVDAGMTEEEAAVLGFGRFPVAGYASYVHDWWFPRWVPTFHPHKGTDVFAAAGTPVRAPWDGVVRITDGSIGGLAVSVIRPDGTYVWMGHLEALAEGLSEGQHVRTGDVVGFVGDSGNAKGGSPHVHLQLHPGGGGPVDPKPTLDAWLDEAERAAPGLVASTLGAPAPQAVVAVGLIGQLAPLHENLDVADRPPRTQLLWASAANPTGGALHLAEAAAAHAAGAVDWRARQRAAAAAVAEWEEAEAQAVAVLAPLTPDPLARALAGLAGDEGTEAGEPTLAGPSSGPPVVSRAGS